MSVSNIYDRSNGAEAIIVMKVLKEKSYSRFTVRDRVEDQVFKLQNISKSNVLVFLTL